MAVQAQDGASSQDLRGLVAAAMAAWPSDGPGRRAGSKVAAYEKLFVPLRGWVSIPSRYAADAFGSQAKLRTRGVSHRVPC
jgi:hypothetical protein